MAKKIPVKKSEINYINEVKSVKSNEVESSSGKKYIGIIIIGVFCILVLLGAVVYFVTKDEAKQHKSSNKNDSTYIDENGDLHVPDQVLDNSDINSNQNNDNNNRNSSNGTYYCDDSSYTLNGNKCEKVEIKDIEKQYYCESGWTLSGNECLKNGTGIETINGTPHYICYSGTLNGSKCEVQSYYMAEVKYICPNGGTYRSYMCYKTETKRVGLGTIDPSLSETSKVSMYNSMQNTCRSYGGTIESNGNSYTCVYNEESSYAATRTEECKNGDKKSGGTCTSTTTTNASVSYYSCPDGYSSSGSKCTKRTSNTESKSASSKDGCPNGFTLTNNRCEKKISINANKK